MKDSIKHCWVLLLTLLCSEPLWASSKISCDLINALGKQQEIHQKNAYSVDGSHNDYHEQFGRYFTNLTGSLRAPYRWVDVGGGSALAMLQNQEQLLNTLAPAELPSNISVSIETPIFNSEVRKLQEKLPKGAIEYVAHGKGIEDFSNEQLSAISNATLVTDRGAASVYTDRPNALYAQFYNMLREGGLLMVSLPPRTKINGGAKSFADWLRSIKGFKVLKITDSGVVLKRTSDMFSAPELKIKSYIPGAPPTREFEWRI